MTDADDLATKGSGAGPRVEVRRTVLEALVAHAREEAPTECCGLLVGRAGRIERAVRARNTLDSPTRYLIDPADQIAATRSARENGEAVVGFYHSHPASSPTPSATDRAEAAYPGHWYLIVSPGSASADAEVRGFRLCDSGNFLPVTLVPIA
jgi:proteasome lid subunit RPN8/RPN11